MDSMESSQSTVTGVNMCNPPSRPVMDDKRSDWFSITCLVEQADATNVELIADQILKEKNLVAGKGLFCDTILKSQSESPKSSDVYAALVAIINPIFPEVGCLLVRRAIQQFKAAYDNGNEKRMQTASRFLAELVNRRVVYEYLAETVLMLLLVNPSSVNVKVAVSFCSQCGPLLLGFIPHKLRDILEEFRRLLIEGAVEKRVRVLIRRLIAAAKGWEFKELDLGDDEDQITHDVSLLQVIEYESSYDTFQKEFGDVSDDDEVSSRAP